MTDLETFCAMLDRADIPCTRELATTDSIDPQDTVVRIGYPSFKDDATVVGYHGFFTDFRFDARTGALKQVGLWE